MMEAAMATMAVSTGHQSHQLNSAPVALEFLYMVGALEILWR